jgi:biotin-dependent carboxylase-like uncharacterized protein
MTGRGLVVVAPGPFTTVQDLGRVGRSAWGVGRSGAADRGAAALANRLVANDPAAAVLETTLGGLVIRAQTAVTLALTGAPAPADLDGRPVGFAAPYPIPAGAGLSLGQPPVGLRTYVAVRGGIDVPPVLGSRSYDVLARLGPPPLRAGDVLAVGPPPRALPHVDTAPIGVQPQGIVDLAVPFGPHLDALAADDIRRLGAVVWTVASDSDRTGLRLDGPALSRVDDREWPPEGLVRGAVQLPPSGRPVLLLADHPVTGGYPAIGALSEAACDRAAQLRPGDQLRLHLR